MREHEEPLVNVSGATGVPGAEMDFVWPSLRRIVEVDGGRAHDLPGRQQRDAGAGGRTSRPRLVDHAHSGRRGVAATMGRSGRHWCVLGTSNVTTVPTSGTAVTFGTWGYWSKRRRMMPPRSRRASRIPRHRAHRPRRRRCAAHDRRQVSRCPRCSSHHPVCAVPRLDDACTSGHRVLDECRAREIHSPVGADDPAHCACIASAGSAWSAPTRHGRRRNGCDRAGSTRLLMDLEQRAVGLFDAGRLHARDVEHLADGEPVRIGADHPEVGVRAGRAT